jgi:DNA repair photolyase
MIVREIEASDYLTKSKIGGYAINPYVGCPHACKYCYAVFMKRFTNHQEPWGEFLDVKRCDKPIDLKKIKGKSVFLSTATDCYNPYEKKYEVTRKILEQLANADCDLKISTRSDLILRDMDLLKKMKRLSVAVSLNTLDEGFREDMDRGSPIEKRLNVLETMKENGIYSILFMSPIFIGITEWEGLIEKTKSYVDEYWFEDLNLRETYKKTILDYIEKKRPELFSTYGEIYVKRDKTKMLEMDNAIKEYCIKNKIKFTDYFHHEEVVMNARDGFQRKDD